MCYRMERVEKEEEEEVEEELLLAPRLNTISKRRVVAEDMGDQVDRGDMRDQVDSGDLFFMTGTSMILIFQPKFTST